METRFSHLYKRDSSVSMLRVKMARRRSQSQKENRDRAVNRHRGLDRLPELEASSLDESTIKTQTGAPRQKQVKSGPSAAAEERMKQLARYKEAKDLKKEKERREKEKKGVFKVGLYKPQPLSILPQVSAAPIRAKTSAPAPSSRVTRSMKQQVQKPQTHGEAVAAPKKDPIVVRAPLNRVVGKLQSMAVTGRGKAAPETAIPAATTRAASRSRTASQAGVRKPAPDTNTNVSKHRAASKQPAASSTGHEKPLQGKAAGRTRSKAQQCTQAAAEEKIDASSTEALSDPEPAQREEQEVEEQEGKTETERLPAASSFAPQGFVFQAPSGLKSFQSVPLTPRSADAFLTPSGVPPALSFSPKDHEEPPRTSPSPPTALSPSSPQEPQHDVPYFRSVLASETTRLCALCEEWELRTEDSSIPEESRDRMRTAMGQARLLMKERFCQFQGLVDDCDLGRGEKITTCTDLQGFWDMVYFQVEDVIKKFDALKEAESRGWQDEHKSPPRPKKTKKPRPAAAAGKAGAGGEASAAARSRLAAVKAAMKAKRAAAAAPTEAQPDPGPPAAQTVVFHGGFFRVESPVRVPGSLRRSSRRSAVPSLPGSPCPGSQFTTPARRRPSAIAHASPLPQFSLSTSTACTPRPLPLALSTPPKPTLHADAPYGQSECDATQPADDQDQQKETHSQSPEVDCCQSQALTLGSETSSQSRLDKEGADLTASPLQCGAEPDVDSCALPFPAVQAPTAEAGGPNCSLSFSPCQSTDVLPAEGHRWSFTLSPCPSNGTEQRALPSPPAPLRPHTPEPCTIDSLAASSEACMAMSPDLSYAENAPGLDFERYLQPTLRCSPSPQVAAVAMEATSLLATPPCADVEMDSPAPEQERLAEEDSLACAGPALAHTPVQLAPLGHVFTPQAHQLEDGELLLFTPELRDRVRQSVCERDLMTFTPPCSR